MSMRFALLALLGLAACSGGQSSAPEPALPAMPMETFKEATRVLSSDEFEGRAPGTAGEKKTLDYLVQQFQKAGLQPGNNGSWFQDVPLVAITAKNVSDLSFTGGSQPISLKYGPEFVAGTYRVTPKIAVKDSPVVFVGYGINAPEKGWNDYAGVDVKGKTVVILVNDPDWQTAEDKGEFNGRAMTYYGRWTYKFEEAARQGAAAAIIVHQTEPAAYGWNVVQSSWTGEQQVADAANGHADQSAAIGWMQLDKAKQLFASGGQDFDKLAAAAKVKGFKPVALGAVKASISFDNDIRKHASKNVIGILPGKARPDEYVLYTAHWDHLGRCEAAPDGDDICNGAVDNATGTAALVALAASTGQGWCARPQPRLPCGNRRGIGPARLEILWRQPGLPAREDHGGVNMDALNMTPPAKNVIVDGQGQVASSTPILSAKLTKQGRVASNEPTPEKGFYYRSDHFMLAKHGVPMLYFDAATIWSRAALRRARPRRRTMRRTSYHGPKRRVRSELELGGRG
jgi:Zn-dependent M28 family amino/carboxypeptidase